MAVAVLFDRLGPYHYARLRAASRQVPVMAVELFGDTADYAWERVDFDADLERVTLFPGRSRREVPVSELARAVEAALSSRSLRAVAVAGWAQAASVVALGWCGRAGVPAIVMSESHEGWSWLRDQVKRRVVGMFAAGLVGGTVHRRYLERLGMAEDRIFTGYDVVDNEHFWQGAARARDKADAVRSDYGLPERYFLASSRFLPKKNLVRLVQAYAAYRAEAGRHAWKLVLLGDGPLRTELLAVRRAHGLEEDLMLPGFRQYGELPAYYGLAGAFVHASVQEEWGLVVNEAMAAGLPVIVSDRCGCARDLVAEGANGFTFAPDRPDELAGLFTRVSARSTDLPAMARAGREIIAKWSPDAFAAGLAAAVGAAAGAGRRFRTIGDAVLLRALLSANLEEPGLRDARHGAGHGRVG